MNPLIQLWEGLPAVLPTVTLNLRFFWIRLNPTFFRPIVYPYAALKLTALIMAWKINQAMRR